MNNDLFSPVGDNDPYFLPGDALLAVLLVVVCSAVYWWGVA